MNDLIQNDDLYLKIKNIISTSKNQSLNILKETSILQHVNKSLEERIQDFLLELGRGFAFVARQKRIKTESSNFYIDLVFYNYILKCFVIIDLKSGKLTHQDVGQMDMYVRMYNDLEKGENDNPTIGIILCADKDNTVVKYSVLNENENLFVSKYQFYLPTEEELKAEIKRDVFELGLMRGNDE